VKIVFAKKSGRTRMTFRREDGTFTSADVGPSLPAHDFAHLVVERALGLSSGFFVNVANGLTFEQLADAAIIRSLGPEPYVAEILARALGELATGACTCDQYADRVATELGQMGLEMPAGVSAESAERMLLELESLMRHFGELSPGESMEVEWKR